ncbi:hypothetical protein [Apilactobacillus kunkeei]|uniref:hypothetical protein n=1 Tax=Apilactobacillus kunkeei TaxID=148814 RepID=UPI00200B2D1B|nr:hypothetical protein [Apilactobacillus kunkeei]MCK8626654.1 hypothetical protein [Apilactobacillus kunkeei]
MIEENMPFFCGENLEEVEITIDSGTYNPGYFTIRIPNYCNFEKQPSYFKMVSSSSIDNLRDKNNLLKEHFSVTFQCQSCRKYIAIHYYSNKLSYGETNIKNYDFSFVSSYFPFKEDESKILKEISPDFEKIYRQASKIESLGYDEFIKMSYRKALETLVKDTLINVLDEDEHKTINDPLGQNLRTMNDLENNEQHLFTNSAQLASWIGNDGAHTKEKHPSLNVQNMKNAIYDFCSSIIRYKHDKYAKEYIEKNKRDSK